MANSELFLPHDLLERAFVRGNSYAWSIADVPLVLEAARKANLINLGGDLQFRFPEGICECYWVGLHGSGEVGDTSLSWNERVNISADSDLAEFRDLLAKFDFLEEGCNGYKELFENYMASGNDPSQIMCFELSLVSESEFLKLGTTRVAFPIDKGPSGS